MEFDTYEGAKL